MDEAAVIGSIPLPRQAQGAGFDKIGNLWMTASSSWFGLLYQRESKDGKPASSFEVFIGIEDIAIDGDGRLWSVSEAGALRWKHWSKTFPVLSQVDVSKLK